MSEQLKLDKKMKFWRSYAEWTKIGKDGKKGRKYSKSQYNRARRRSEQMLIRDEETEWMHTVELAREHWNTYYSPENRLFHWPEDEDLCDGSHWNKWDPNWINYGD